MTRVAEKSSGKPRDLADAALLASHVHKTFQMGESTIEVLKDVNLLVRRGEFIAIEGRSGSGKSTLLHIMGGLDSANSGTVEFESEDIGELARKAVNVRGLFGSGADRRLAKIRNTHFGFVFQFYHLLPELNVIENTMLSAMIQYSWLGYRARRQKLAEKAADVLKELGMEHRLRHRPNQLSGGERQRVAIARALMNDPKVLYADEPTGNLDAETGQQIMGVFERLHRERGQTIVMVTHDRTLARRADRVLILKDGKLEPPVPSQSLNG